MYIKSSWTCVSKIESPYVTCYDLPLPIPYLVFVINLQYGDLNPLSLVLLQPWILCGEVSVKKFLLSTLDENNLNKLHQITCLITGPTNNKKMVALRSTSLNYMVQASIKYILVSSASSQHNTAALVHESLNARALTLWDCSMDNSVSQKRISFFRNIRTHYPDVIWTSEKPLE